VNVYGQDIDRKIYRDYTTVDDLYEIFEVFEKLEKFVKYIDILSIVFDTANTKSNIIKINRFIKKIMSCKLFKDFCEFNHSKILLYNEELGLVRKFNITLDNDESYKNMDLHILAKTRSNYYIERTLPADS